MPYHQIAKCQYKYTYAYIVQLFIFEDLNFRGLGSLNNFVGLYFHDI